MNSRHRSQMQLRAGAHARRSAFWLRRASSLASWIVPSAVLALIPKCPVCVAAYVALATGIGISLPTAKYLRVALVAVCIVSLAFIVIRRVRSLLARRVSPEV